MEAKEAEQLRKDWGKKPCNHPNIQKEYDLGAHTGDYVCTVCGSFVEDMFGNKIGPGPKESNK